MGKKRFRSAHSRNTNDLEVQPKAEHPQSLLDDVREARDIEFAAEKRIAERSKRRKLVQRRPARPRAPQAPDTFSQEKPGNATRHIETTLDVGNLTKSGIDLKTSAKISETAMQQRAEIRKESQQSASNTQISKTSIHEDLNGVGESRSRRTSNLSDSDADSDNDDHENTRSTEFDVHSADGEDKDELNFLDASRITDEEEVALAMFSSSANVTAIQSAQPALEKSSETPESSGTQRIMLADIILAKIREKQEADAKAAADAADPARAEREKKIAEVYGLVGNIMSKYRSGKVPKAFKVIPKQSTWEDLLYLTRPDEWSPAAVYVATRLLASNLRAKQVVRYYSDILLPRCLDDIAENKKLNYHLYRALGKAVYKPEAFCKGILFPLCEDPSCTLRQATIIGSVIAKVSIPMLHSAAALLYICELPYSPPNSIIITALVEKKYALPYRVLDAVVESFLRMKTDPRPLPVMWHQSLLCFAQRYKTELSMEQKEDLKLLMRVQTHHAITAEIRRELFSARNRGDSMDPDANTIARNVRDAGMED